MKHRINPEWITERLLEINQGKITYTSENLSAIRWLILALNEKKLPFRLINLGAGIKTITTETDICPKCHGTGRY